MISPIISYYAKMEYCTEEGKKTPKYKVVKALGNYPPMEALKNKRGEICFYLMPTRGEKRNAPPMYLQVQNTSLNFTGLHHWKPDCKALGYAYGYPLSDKTYSKDNKPNPFYNYSEDGYLFVIHQSNRPTPDVVELIILEGAKSVIPLFLEQLEKGKLDAEVETLRGQII